MTVWTRFWASFWPDLSAATQPDQFHTQKQRAVAAVVGAIACFLAFYVVSLDASFGPACARSSISHYYYEPLAGTLMVMSLSFVAAFMIAYEGRAPADGWIAAIGGIGALLVAFFPTDGLGCPPGLEADFRPAITFVVPDAFTARPFPETFDMTDAQLLIGGEDSQKYHMWGAGILFASLLYFTIFAFSRTNHPDDRIADPNSDSGRGRWTICKWIRNLTYWLFGVIMLIGIAMILPIAPELSDQWSLRLGRAIAALPPTPDDPTPYPRPVYHGELLALGAFGLSWLLNGRLFFAIVKFLYQNNTRVIGAIEEIEKAIACRER